MLESIPFLGWSVDTIVNQEMQKTRETQSKISCSERGRCDSIGSGSPVYKNIFPLRFYKGFEYRPLQVKYFRYVDHSVSLFFLVFSFYTVHYVCFQSSLFPVCVCFVSLFVDLFKGSWSVSFRCVFLCAVHAFRTKTAKQAKQVIGDLHIDNQHCRSLAGT